ncbi:MAG: GAF domain-containing sensor histidine kinase, partial [Chloroflexota bacterium]|nr:GAF domain-containing sensor histidine kinase [Chloroflexota bacterium]
PNPLRLPLVYQGEEVGHLLLGPRAGETFAPADRRLLTDLARQAGVAAHAVRLTAELQCSNENLKMARERLITAREEERRRLRRDLHDGLGPALAAESLKVGAIRKLLVRDQAAADSLLVELANDIEVTIAEIRRLVYDLRPPALDDLGLVTALREHAAQYQGHATADECRGDGGIQVEVEAPEHLPPLPAAVEVAAYRTVQEALTNVARHACARRCTVRLSLEQGAVCLEVTDDGRGLPVDRKSGVGLLSMRERAEELGGTFTAEVLPTGGTRSLARFPRDEEG